MTEQRRRGVWHLLAFVSAGSAEGERRGRSEQEGSWCAIDNGYDGPEMQLNLRGVCKC